MVFCSNCGKEIVGSAKFCNSCGYKISEEELNILRGKAPDAETGTKAGAESRGKDSEVVKEHKMGEYDEEGRVPMGAKVKHKVPKSTRCVTCNLKTDDICYFCSYAVCDKHRVKMQIFADKSKFGNAVGSCHRCADAKNGRQPTKDEAEDIGFFFKIKPYHEWKILDK